MTELNCLALKIIRLLDYFQFFVILNKANRNIHVHIFYAMFSLLLCKKPRSGSVGTQCRCIFNFIMNRQTFQSDAIVSDF